MSPLVDHALERTLVMAIVVAPELARELPAGFDGGALGDWPARATWEALCRLLERGEPVHLESVRDEIAAWCGHDQPHWFARPNESWPWSMVDTAGLLAERLARDPSALPIAAWAQSLQRIAEQRLAAIELDEDIVVEPESEERQAA